MREVTPFLRVVTMSSREAAMGASYFTNIICDDAAIKINGRTRVLGTFDTPEEAHDAYVAAAKLAWGAFHRSS